MIDMSNNHHIDAIFNRFSCRSFQDKAIPESVIRDMMRAGSMAPASGNMQPWEFILVNDEDMKTNIVKHTFGGFYSKTAKSQDWMAYAPIIMVVCVNFKRTVAKYGDLGYKWATIDTASAVQNILLTATEMGVASCWVGGFLEEEIQNLLRIPPYVQPIGLIPMGYPAEKPDYKQKLDPEWFTHGNMYNKPYFK